MKPYFLYETSPNAFALAKFSLFFDVDGNQTTIKTGTGIWSAVYNAENRPVSFTNTESNTVVECAYDSMGRRAYKKVTVDGNVTLHQRYIYRGYLQIAALDLTRTAHPALWYITWDPLQPVATRPLAIQINGTWYTYGWDLTKNICELYSTAGSISTSYTYTPFGQVTASGSVTQIIQWSSEVWDSELGLVYYNWRYYNAVAGRWMRREPLEVLQGYNDYIFNQNIVLYNYDILGLNTVVVSGGINTNRDVDDRHDANWRNFISSAAMRIRELKASCANEKIEWFVNKTSYEKRVINDLSRWDTLVRRSAHSNPNVDADWNSRIRYHTIMEIESLAKELNVSLRWYKSKHEFEQLLRFSPEGMKVRSGCSKIDKFIYYGHGYVGKLAIIYGGGKDIREETIDESSFDSVYFANNSYIDLVTCHSASRPKGNPEKESLAKEINLKLGGVAYGYDGRVDYAPVYDGKMPKEGKSINKNDAIIDPSKERRYFFKKIYEVERKIFINIK